MLGKKIGEQRLKGVKIGTSVPVLCEIEFGVQSLPDPHEYRANLQRTLRQVRIWPLTYAIAKQYGVIAHDCRKRGRVLSQIDIMLVAFAREMNLVLVTTDRDFEAFPDIVTQNWLA